MKKGITVSMIAIFVTIMLILATTISMSATKTIANAKIRSFATEISIISSEVLQRLKQDTNLDYTSNIILMDLTNVADSIKSEQFAGEDIVANTIQLYELNLDALELHNTKYGRKNTVSGKDIYAVSLKTGRVYYVEGIKGNNTTYYTLTESLQLQLGNKYQAVSNMQAGVSFTPSNTYWTNEKVTTKVAYPSTFTNVVVSATNGVQCGEVYSENENNVVQVNTTNVATNYDILVTYIKGEENKEETFKIKNYDNVSPVITNGTQTYVKNSKLKAYILDIKATDDNSGIKTFKYESEKIELQDVKEYFQNYGKNVTDDKILLDDRSTYYTLYAEDNAGNVAVKHIKIDDDILLLRDQMEN